MAESAETLEHHRHAVEMEREGLFVRIGPRRLRLDYLLLAALGIFAVTVAALYFALDLGTDDVERWGYAGLFGIVLLRAASVVMPMPGGGIVFASGGLLNPLWGIPAPMAVGVIAGFAESLGEFTGYFAGLGGSSMLRERRIYKRIKGWVKHRPFLTMFLMSFTPPWLFDIAGLAAGAIRVPIRVFYPAVLSGKVIRDILVATAGYYSIGIVESWSSDVFDGVKSVIDAVAGIF